LEARSIRRENRELKRTLRTERGFGTLIGTSPAMLRLYEMIERVAQTKTNVLITGESGTGKEMIARTIHAEGERSGGPFVPVNCGAIPENLVESELFGHVKGSFTGAVYNKEGLFELANGGTLFLDEVGELPLAAQVKLLRALQERTIRRVGGGVDIRVDVRIISATNRVLEDLLRSGAFREDLYYRLNVIELRVPPLRERREDIALLARHFLEKHAAELGRPVARISGEANERLESHDYPGNVRELENMIERAVALETSDVIFPETLAVVGTAGSRAPAPGAPPAAPGAIPDDGVDLDGMLAAYEKDLIVRVLQSTGGVKKRAAEALGVSFRSLRYRLEKYGMSVGDDEEP
ncbi:MAG: sigma-54-dependent Fis family transcriptional regulator, partial [Myxococcales bacterium]|nr:sigma-54-dependent Fis family transcriptional regulator [Myxococcales bacterium]